MSSKPSAVLVGLCSGTSTAAIMAAVYFGGTGNTPAALIGTTLFVAFGGLAFELLRRRGE
jgi:hypothetical protein